MKPEDRKRLKQHIEMIVEHKEPEEIVRENFKQLQDEVADLREKNIKLRLELQTLRFKESQENRFVWWVYQVYAKHVSDLLTELERTTFPVTPFGMSNTVKRLREYTEHIYDGTYLDTAMSTEQSNTDVSMTQDILIDIKTPQSIENTNPDYYKDEIGALDALRAELARRDEIIKHKEEVIGHIEEKKKTVFELLSNTIKRRNKKIAEQADTIRKLKEDGERLAGGLDTYWQLTSEGQSSITLHRALMNELEED